MAAVSVRRGLGCARRNVLRGNAITGRQEGFMTTDRLAKHHGLSPMTLAIMLIAGGIVLAQPARAHDWYNSDTGHTFNNPTSALIESMIQHRMQEQALARSFGSPERGQATEPLAPRHKPLSATDFRPVSRRHPTAESLVASIADSTHRLQLAAVVTTMFARLGAVRPNNIATALATVVGLSRQAIKGEVLSDGAFEVLRAGFNDRLATAPAFAELSDFKKQALYEYLVFNTAVLALANQAGKTDPQAKASGVALARALLERFSPAASR
jgi:hypothetical protein